MRNKARTISNAMSFFIVASAVWVGATMPQRHNTIAGTETTGDWQLHCLAQNIYHEARGERELGQVAVAYVTVNRAKSGKYPAGLCKTVWQSKQFSWTHDGRSDRMTDIKAVEKSVDIALAVVRGQVKDPTNGMLNYYNHAKVNPVWAAKKDYYIIVDNHTFLTAGRAR